MAGLSFLAAGTLTTHAESLTFGTGVNQFSSMDEWYKAAYYDANLNGGLGGYFNYATGSDTEPMAVAGGTTAGTAVFKMQAGPADITNAGGLSPYGTMAQNGNGNWALGVSMGGPNALQLYRDLEGSPGHFERVVLVAPRPERFGRFKATYEHPRDVLVIQGQKDKFRFYRRNQKAARKSGFCMVTHSGGHRLPPGRGNEYFAILRNGPTLSDVSVIRRLWVRSQ